MTRICAIASVATNSSDDRDILSTAVSNLPGDVQPAVAAAATNALRQDAVHIFSACVGSTNQGDINIASSCTSTTETAETERNRTCIPSECNSTCDIHSTITATTANALSENSSGGVHGLWRFVGVNRCKRFPLIDRDI
ncbi:MAG: hypothetical protein EBQ71_10075 [Betaproteobacteria bacterium]|nr:hypothetical protein [Betaproteobacteria bacterium]